MERLIYVCFWLILVLDLVLQVSGNSEGDALNALKTNLVDPNNVFQNWDPTDTNPCRWNNITCNADNSVTRIDLGNTNLSGQLVPELGQLANLQYLELYSNNISGIIPDEIGNLTDLVSLDLYLNALTGHIPTTMGNLRKLRFLRLHNNMLTGEIPMSLTTIDTLQAMDFSNNQLVGDVPVNGSFYYFTPTSFINNRLNSPPYLPPPPGQSTASTSSGNNVIGGAIVGLGVVAGALLLFSAPAIISA